MLHKTPVMILKENILKKIEISHRNISPNYNLISYKDINKKQLNNLYKFDKSIMFDTFVGIYDFSVSNSASDGIVFVYDGIYINDTLKKKFIAYNDIESIVEKEGFLGGANINTQSRGSYFISNSYYQDFLELKSLLFDIKDLSTCYCEENDIPVQYIEQKGGIINIKSTAPFYRNSGKVEKEIKKLRSIIKEGNKSFLFIRDTDNELEEFSKKIFK